jgi:hypothetical protein
MYVCASTCTFVLVRMFEGFGSFGRGVRRVVTMGDWVSFERARGGVVSCRGDY